jgi:hypothetical protein
LCCALALGRPVPAGEVAPTPDRGARKSVSSTSLSSVGYDPASGVLEVEFKSGAIYRYHGVPEAVHRNLMTAESKGRFFTRNIRGRYTFERVAEARP